MKQILILFFGFFAVSWDANGTKVPLDNQFIYQVAPDPVNIPVVSGSLTIDGKLDEPFWESAHTQKLTNTEIDSFGKFAQGGETGIAVRGDYLILNARMPESDKVIARSTGINPTWWWEDMVVWRFRYKSPETDRNMSVTLAANSLGAFSLFDEGNWSMGDLINSPPDFTHLFAVTANYTGDVITYTGKPLNWASEVLAAAVIGDSEWTVEIALPREQFGPMGFFSMERVRAPRTNAPVLSWYWPAQNELQYFEMPKSNIALPILYQPTILPKNNIIKGVENGGSPLADEVSALPKHAWTTEDQKSLGLTIMLERSLKTRMAEFAEKEKVAWGKVKTVEDWERFRNKRLAAMRNQIGPLPERTPLRATVTRRSNYGDGFVIENIVYESRPNFTVTTNLYLPENPSENIPAIVVIHSHHAPKTHQELQNMGMTWARAGSAVLIMDQINGGERSQSQPWPRESYYGRYATGNQLYLAGESLIKWMAWDVMRGIDLLLERPYIDPDRIILLGGVAGGGDPAALVANLDPRVAALIPFTFGETRPERLYIQLPRPYDFGTAHPGWGYWETTRNLPNSVRDQFFSWFLATAGAPRPFILSSEVGWPKTVEEEPMWARYKKVYDLYGASNNLAEVQGVGPFPGPGEVTNVGPFHRKQIYPILNRWFQVPIPNTEYHNVRPESELIAMTAAAAVKHNPQPVSSLSMELALERLTAAKSKRQGLTPDERKKVLREDLKKKLGEIEPVNNPLTKTLWSKQYSKFKLEASSIESDKGITIPVFLLIPDNNSGPRPVVIALAEGGKEGFLSERHNEIASLLEKGITVCLPDLRGTGELSSATSRGPGSMGLAATELMLGQTLAGSQLKDTRTIFHWLAKRSDIDPNLIALWGDSFSEPNAPDFQFDQSPGQLPGKVPQRQAEPLGSLLAILTALYEDNIAAVACSGGLVSFLSVLEDRFCHIPQDVIVPGILEVTDLGEIVASIAPRPILLEKMVNGLNKKVSVITMKKEYGTKISSNLILREEADKDFPLAVWLSKQCLKK